MTPEARKLQTLLREQGYFATTQRMELFEQLQQHGELTMKQLLSLRMRQDQATLYRNIKVFEEIGVVRRLQLSWHSRLELSDLFRHHHHHLSCLTCGKVFPLPDNKYLEKAIDQTVSAFGFIASEHDLEIRGHCAACTESNL